MGQSADDFLAGVQAPGAPGASLAGGQSADDFLAGISSPGQQTTTPAVAPSSDTWLAKAKMMGAEAFQGLGHALTPGGYVSGAMGGVPSVPDQYLGPVSLPDFGTGPEAQAHPYLAGAAAGGGGALPYVLAGGGPAALAAGVGGGLGSTAGEQLTGSKLGGLVGGVVGGGTAGGLTNLAGRTANALTGNTNEFGSAFDTLGLSPTSPAMTASSDMTAKTLAPYTNNTRVGQDLGSAVEATAAKLGQSQTLQDAGTVAQNEARDWLTNQLPAKLAIAWAPVDAAMPADTKVPITNFTQALQGMVGADDPLNPVTKLLKPSLPGKMLAVLTNPKTNSGAAGPIGENTTWADVKNLRTTVGDALADPTVVKDIPQQQLTKLYSALTADMKTATQFTSPDAFDAFNSANAESSRLYNFAEGTVGKIIAGKTPSPDDPAPGDVASSLLASAKKGSTTFDSLATEMPGTLRELGAFKLRQMGLTDPTDATSSISPKLVNALAPGNLAPEARSVLFGPVSPQVDAIETLANRLNTVGKAKPAGGIVPGGLNLLAHNAAGTSLGALSGYLLGHGETSGTLLGGELGGTALMGAGAVKNALGYAAARSPLLAKLLAGKPANPLFPGSSALIGTIGQ